MRPLIGLTLLLLLASPATAARERFKQLRDWYVSCDNLRACTAFGFGAEGDDRAHLRIARGAEADAVPEVTVTLMRDGLDAGARLKLSFGDPALGGLPPEPVAVRLVDEDTAVVRIPWSEALAAALRKGEMLRVEEVGGAPGGDGVPKISLAGAVASLLFMDEQQKRVGTVTALAAKGAKPASAVPAPPAMPVVRVAKPVTGGAPLPKTPPAAVLAAARKAAADIDGVSRPEPFAVRLSATQTLWGVAIEVPAYNIRYALYLAEGGRVRPAVLHDPQGTRDAANEATLPEFDSATNTLRTFYRGRGIGDCGAISEWGWDGSRFRLISEILMAECRGVRPEHWPTSYRARRE